MRSPEVVILGAGRPYQGAVHSGLLEAPDHRRVLDWLLAAYESIGARTQFVGGYAVEEIVSRYPGLKVAVNHDWASTRSAWSLACADLVTDSDCYVTYADVLYRRNAIARLSATDAEITVGVDRAWRTRYSGRDDADLRRCEKVVIVGDAAVRLGADLDHAMASAEFIGLARFSPTAIAAVKQIALDEPALLRKANLSALIELLRLRGMAVSTVDVAGDWAELNEPRDIAHFVLGTKAETLARLKTMVTRSRIEDQVAFDLVAWRSDPEALLRAIRGRFGGKRAVVRSSALSEDGFGSANAGAYDSVLGVEVDDPEALRAAIVAVVGSYPDDARSHQVLVQPMVADVVASGVVFTRSLSHGAPYWVVNYDDSSSRTDTVTSGRSNALRTHVVSRSCVVLPAGVPAVVRSVIEAVREVEVLLHYDALDVEFAVDATGAVTILQVRPIAVRYDSDRPTDDEVFAHIERGVVDFKRASVRSPRIVGLPAVFGVMPDWNPAEIIGTSPSRLASTLYDHLIMGEVWATQRAEFGYRDLRPHALMVLFAGHPYVDVRASFNSFIPAALDEALADKLANHYLDKLRGNPHLHDKVEFEVVPTCFGLDFERWANELDAAGFKPDEIAALRAALIELTRAAIDRVEGQYASLREVEARTTTLLASELPPLRKVHALLDDCRRFGTLPFAHLARLAFVAMTILRSAVRTDVVTQAEVDSFLKSIRTVSHRFTDDAAAVRAGTLGWESFVAIYGHLRPGTYDACSPSYAEDPEAFLRPIVTCAEASHEVDAGDHRSMLDRISASLATAGIMVDARRLETFLRGAIEGREHSKFVFSRSLSKAIDELVAYGASIGLERAELANLDLDVILSERLGSGVAGAAAELKAVAAKAAHLRHLAEVTEFPPLVTGEDDFRAFEHPGAQANFVGSGKVTAECVDIGRTRRPEDADLAGRIALVEQADPGYDWLFGRGIGGLITMYGGANSHMAIRAAEFGIPAAIGLGESAYRRLSGATLIELNAGNRQVTVLR